MSLPAALHSFAARFLHRAPMDPEIDEELHSHLALRADDLERLALIEFGGYHRLKDDCREAFGTRFAETLLQDVRFGLRMMRKKPGFSIVAVLTLACAIGANAVAFSVFNGLVLRPNNLPRPRELYMIEEGKHHFQQSYPDFLDIRDRTRTLSGVLAFDIVTVGLDTGMGSSHAVGMETSANYFDVLGVQPFLGRFFHASDEHGPGSAPYLVLSYGF